jgi:malonate transporter
MDRLAGGLYVAPAYLLLDEKMAAIFGALFPIFALIVLGYGSGKKQWFGPDADRVLNAYVANLALPLLIFHALAGMNGPDLIQPVMIAVVVGSSLLLYAAYYWIEKARGLSLAQANSAAFAASYGNHSFIGMPVCLAVLGAQSMAPAVVVMALNSSFVFGIGTLMAVLTAPQAMHDGEAERRSIVRALGMAARNPLVIGAAAGMILAFTDWEFPAPVDQFLTILAASTAPCALIAVGLFMARPVPESAGTGATWRSIFGKLILLPIITAAMLWMLPPLPVIWYQTAMIMAACPAASGCFALGSFGGDAALRLAARVIVLSTIMAAATMPVLLILLGR